MSWHLVTKHDDEIEANVAAESHDHFVLPPVAIVDVYYHWEKGDNAGSLRIICCQASGK